LVSTNATPSNLLASSISLTAPVGGAYALISLTDLVIKDGTSGTETVALTVDAGSVYSPTPFAMIGSQTLALPLVFRTALLAAGAHTFNATFATSAGSSLVEGQMTVQLVAA
jgi:hypothetical protein